MKLISEIVDKDVTFDFDVVVEATSPKEPQKIKIKGPYIACDVTNVNGRLYKLDYFEKEVIPEYMKTWVTPRRAYAELNHAQSHVVNPKDACELITNLTLDGKSYIGESIILNSDPKLGIPGTPNGDILAAILLRGGRIGKSTRGVVDDPNNKVIDENNQFSLITIDTVLDPSGPGCYINDVVMEEKDYMVNEHGLVVECAYKKLEKTLNDDYTTTFNQELKKEFMLKAFKQFLDDIRK